MTLTGIAASFGVINLLEIGRIGGAWLVLLTAAIINDKYLSHTSRVVIVTLLLLHIFISMPTVH